jgi:hypothetical protein
MPSGGAGGRRLGWGAGLCLSLASAAVFLLLLEGGARLVVRLTGDRILTIPARYYWENTPRMRKMERGTLYEINPLGFRGPAQPFHKPPGTARVVCVGDSSTFGFLNREEECYPRLLEECLAGRGKGRRVEVVNAGVSGYTTLQEALALKLRVLPLAPDVVVIQCGHNNRSMTVSSDRSGLYRSAGAMGRLVGGSRFLYLAGTAARRLGLARPPGRFDLTESLANVRGDLSLMVDLCRQGGAKVIFVSWGQHPEISARTEEGIRLYELGRPAEALPLLERAAGIEYNWDWRPAHYLRLCALATGDAGKARRAEEVEKTLRREHPWVIDERPYLDAFRAVAAAKGVPLIEYRGEALRPSLFLDICHPSPEFTRRIAHDLCARIDKFIEE